MLQTSSSEVQEAATPKEELLNTTCDTASPSSDEEEEEEDAVAPLPHLSRRSSDLKIASQTRDVRYILHKMRERRGDVHLQIWAVDALRNCEAEDSADEITKNIIRGMQRHPYSTELQHKAVVSLCHLGKTCPKVKDSLATPEGMDILLSALQQPEAAAEEEAHDDDKTDALSSEVHMAVLSLLANGFDQFDHSMLVYEGAVPAIVQVLQQLTDDDTTETLLEWGTLALGELSWLCQDLTVPQVFPDLPELIDLIVGGAMNRYPYNSNIQNNCGEILRHIMGNDPDSVSLVKDAGGASALILALHNHLDQEDVLVEGCLTLTHFLPFPDIRDECFTTVLTTMAQHVETVDVQQGGCAFLADAADHDSNCFRFLFDTTQAVPLLMTAMEWNPDNDRLQEHGCRAFQRIAPWLKQKSERKRLKIMGLVVAAMKNHHDNESYYWLQLYGCQALEAMVSSWGDDATVFMVKVGGIKCLQATMEQFMEDAEILWPGLAIVSHLDLMGNKFARDAVMKEQCIRLIMDAIKRHGGHERVQEVGAKVLDMLANVNLESNQQVDLDRTGDCCVKCLKISLSRESGERWKGCTCSS